MLTKSKIALSTLLVFSLASAALAAEVPENKIGDRYTFLDQTIQHPSGASAYAAADVQRSIKPYTAEEKARFDRETATHGIY